MNKFVPKLYKGQTGDKYTNPVALPRFVKNDPPMPAKGIFHDGILAWFSGGKYLGHTSIGAGKSFARKHGGGSTRSRGAWIPSIDDKATCQANGNFEAIGAIGIVHRPALKDFGDQAYLADFDASIGAGDDFGHAALCNDPEQKLEQLRAQYQNEVDQFEKQLTMKYVDLAHKLVD